MSVPSLSVSPDLLCHVIGNFEAQENEKHLRTDYSYRVVECQVDGPHNNTLYICWLTEFLLSNPLP